MDHGALFLVFNMFETDWLRGTEWAKKDLFDPAMIPLAISLKTYCKGSARREKRVIFCPHEGFLREYSLAI
jgi:hypothetical protein